MQTELLLADGQTLLVEEGFDEVLAALARPGALVELRPYRSESVPRHGYDASRSEERVAVNPAHVVAVRATS